MSLTHPICTCQSRVFLAIQATFSATIGRCTSFHLIAGRALHDTEWSARAPFFVAQWLGLATWDLKNRSKGRFRFSQFLAKSTLFRDSMLCTHSLIESKLSTSSLNSPKGFYCNNWPSNRISVSPTPALIPCNRQDRLTSISHSFAPFSPLIAFSISHPDPPWSAKLCRVAVFLRA